MLQPYLTPPELPETQLMELYDYAMSFVERNHRDLMETLFDVNLTLFREYRIRPRQHSPGDHPLPGLHQPEGRLSGLRQRLHHPGPSPRHPRPLRLRLHLHRQHRREPRAHPTPRTPGCSCTSPTSAGRRSTRPTACCRAPTTSASPTAATTATPRPTSGTLVHPGQRNPADRRGSQGRHAAGTSWHANRGRSLRGRSTLARAATSFSGGPAAAAGRRRPGGVCGPTLK